MTSFSGRSTAMRRSARLFRSSRTQCSRSASSTTLAALVTPMRSAEVADRLRRVAAAAQAGERRHARIVPAARPGRSPPAASSLRLLMTVWRQVQARELDLLRVEDAERVEVPVVERPVVLVLQRAQRVRHALDRVGLAVRPVVHRIDAPRVARALVRGLADPVHHRVAQVDVRRRHVDLRAQRLACRRRTRRRACARNRSRFSSTERLRYGLSRAGLGQRAASLAHLLGREVVDVGLAGAG